MKNTRKGGKNHLLAWRMQGVIYIIRERRCYLLCMYVCILQRILLYRLSGLRPWTLGLNKRLVAELIMVAETLYCHALYYHALY